MPGVLVHPTDPNTTTTLNYTVPPKNGERLANYVDEPPAGVPKSNIQTESHEVTITDLRPLVDSGSDRSDKIGLDKTGFEIVGDFETKLTEEDFYDDEKIKDVYYKEVEEQLKKSTGATRVFIFDHTIRRRSPGTVDQKGNRQPGLRTHVDQSARAGASRVDFHMGDEAERLSKGRVQVINFWRPIRGPVQDAPLAVADFWSLNPDQDLIPTALIYPNRDGETLGVRYSPDHRWFWLSDQQPNEVLLIKCYDSKAWDRENNKLGKNGIASLTPHTAFIDPRFEGKSGVKLRHSIEVRTLVFHENDQEN